MLRVESGGRKENLSWHKKEFWDIAKKGMLEDSGAMPMVEGDLVTNFPSCWLMEDTEI